MNLNIQDRRDKKAAPAVQKLHISPKNAVLIIAKWIVWLTLFAILSFTSRNIWLNRMQTSKSKLKSKKTSLIKKVEIIE